MASILELLHNCRHARQFIHSFIPFNSGSKAHKTTGKSNYIKIHKHKNTERQTENTQEKTTQLHYKTTQKSIKQRTERADAIA